MGSSELSPYIASLFDAALTWKDVEWLAGVTKLPILVKGILRLDDARRATKLGASGIIVSTAPGSWTRLRRLLRSYPGSSMRWTVPLKSTWTEVSDVGLTCSKQWLTLTLANKSGLRRVLLRSHRW